MVSFTVKSSQYSKLLGEFYSSYGLLKSLPSLLPYSQSKALYSLRSNVLECHYIVQNYYNYDSYYLHIQPFELVCGTQIVDYACARSSASHLLGQEAKKL